MYKINNLGDLRIDHHTWDSPCVMHSFRCMVAPMTGDIMWDDPRGEIMLSLKLLTITMCVPIRWLTSGARSFVLRQVSTSALIWPFSSEKPCPALSDGMREVFIAFYELRLLEIFFRT